MPEDLPVQDPTPAPDTIPVTPERTLYLGTWSTRFWAWLIDIVLVILFLNIIRGIFEPFWTLPFLWDISHWEFFERWFEMFLIFIYWTSMEGFRGQSIGKMVMNLRVVNRDGSRISYTTAAIESLSKAFLPGPFIIVFLLDCLIGWLAMPGTKLRVFNRISNTLVIKTDYREPAGVVYVKEKE